MVRPSQIKAGRSQILVPNFNVKNYLVPPVKKESKRLASKNQQKVPYNLKKQISVYYSLIIVNGQNTHTNIKFYVSSELTLWLIFGLFCNVRSYFIFNNAVYKLCFFKDLRKFLPFQLWRKEEIQLVFLGREVLCRVHLRRSVKIQLYPA